MKPRYLLLLLGIIILGIGALIVFGKSTNTLVNTSPIQSHRSYTAVTQASGKTFPLNTDNLITFQIVDDEQNTLKDFSVVHEKIMHLIVVRKDLQYFQHLHPEFNADTGTFVQMINFSSPGEYRIFPDFTPGNSVNFMQLPVTSYFDVIAQGEGEYMPVVKDTNDDIILQLPNKTYAISYVFPEVMQSQEQLDFGLYITKDSQPVTNLQNYLGAKGHSVIIKADTLDFIHTHATEAEVDHSMHGMGMSMAPSSSGPEIDFSTNLPSPGLYKIFTQFQHEGEVYTVDKVIEVL